MPIQVFKSDQEASQLILNIMKNFQEKGNTLVALSGGSTIPPLLKNVFQNKHEVSQCAWTWIDERLVKYNKKGSNYGDVKKIMADVNCIPLPCAEGNEEKIQYQNTISSMDFPHPNLLILGFGDDGHIASLFPHSNALRYEGNEKDWLIRSEASYEPRQRWTWTMKALVSSKTCFVIFKGDDFSKKYKHIKDALKGNTNTPLGEFIQSYSGRLIICQIKN